MINNRILRMRKREAERHIARSPDEAKRNPGLLAGRLKANKNPVVPSNARHAPTTCGRIHSVQACEVECVGGGAAMGFLEGDAERCSALHWLCRCVMCARRAPGCASLHPGYDGTALLRDGRPTPALRITPLRMSWPVRLPSTPCTRPPSVRRARHVPGHRPLCSPDPAPGISPTSPG